MGLEAAFSRVGMEMTRSHPLLAEQLGAVVLELRAGRSQEDALRRMADRAGADEIRAFATLLIQSNKLGSSIAQTLAHLCVGNARAAPDARRGKGAPPAGAAVDSAGGLHAAGDDRRADAAGGDPHDPRRPASFGETDMTSASLRCSALAAIGAASCSSGELEVRSIKQPLAEGRQPANFRVAEGNAQLALGNVGLALEAYRKALREQPDSVDAMVGLATCYDRMGRPDLSRRHYEMALAVDPANTDIYSLFAQSLEGQGQRDEAARVKTELAARVVAPEAPREAPGSVPVLPPPPAQSVTVALAPPRSAPVAVERPRRRRPAGAAVDARSGAGHQARAALGGANRRRGPRPARPSGSKRSSQPAVTLLNAARVQGLAARTRAYLAQRGFAAARIGDAPAVRRQSAILYSRGRCARAPSGSPRSSASRLSGARAPRRAHRSCSAATRRANSQLRPTRMIFGLALALALADPAPAAPCRNRPRRSHRQFR